MVRIKKKNIGKQAYFYIEHTINRRRKKEKYLGKTLPKNIDDIKKEFLSEIYKEKYYPLLDKLKKNFSKEIKKTPLISRKKETETFMIKFTYNSQKIEGSKLTLRETANLFEKGITPKEKPIEDVKEAESHKKVFYEMLNYKKNLSLQIILGWHHALFKNTKPEIAGKIRKHHVEIAGSKFIPPLSVELYPLLREFLKWYNKNKNKLHPIELAALTHLKFVTIHPFADGNGRISRLIMNFILNKHKLPLLNISYGNRNSYYNALERSQIKKIETIFLQWFFKKYIKEYKTYLK